jgi:NitT/TauT family transport system substrate-binding protein
LRSVDIAIALACVGLTSCGGNEKKIGPFRLGYFPNITHAQALVGQDEGLFARALNGEPLDFKIFTAGPAAMEALLAGSLDASYVGGSPALIAYVRSRGEVHVVAGAASGGSLLVAKTAQTPSDLKGKRVASPQIGNSQDVSLRHWLKANHLSSDFGAERVQVFPISNAEILGLFRRGELEAAWVPEPWASRLIVEAGAHVLVDERDLWEGGRFPVTVLVATARALRVRREEIKAIVRAHIALTERWQAEPDSFAQKFNAAFGKLTAHPLRAEILNQAFSRLELTTDPFEQQFPVVQKYLEELGYLPHADVAGLVDRSLLNEIQARR